MVPHRGRQGRTVFPAGIFGGLAALRPRILAGVAEPDDELTAELTSAYWRAYDERRAAISFRAMARTLRVPNR